MYTACIPADKRTETNPVSGSIKLNLSVAIEGENVKVPLQEQYTKLHEVELNACVAHFFNYNIFLSVATIPVQSLHK